MAPRPEPEPSKSAELEAAAADPNKSGELLPLPDPKMSADELTVLTCPAGLKNGSWGRDEADDPEPDRLRRMSTEGLVQATEGLAAAADEPKPRSRRSVSLAGLAKETVSLMSFGGNGGAFGRGSIKSSAPTAGFCCSVGEGVLLLSGLGGAGGARCARGGACGGGGDGDGDGNWSPKSIDLFSS